MCCDVNRAKESVAHIVKQFIFASPTNVGIVRRNSALLDGILNILDPAFPAGAKSDALEIIRLLTLETGHTGMNENALMSRLVLLLDQVQSVFHGGKTLSLLLFTYLAIFLWDFSSIIVSSLL